MAGLLRLLTVLWLVMKTILKYTFLSIKYVMGAIKGNPQVQTIAVILVVLFVIFLHIATAMSCYALFLTQCWPMLLLYVTIAITYDQSTPSTHGRRMNWVRNLPLWRYTCSYFPVRLVKTADLDAKNNYIFAFHPNHIMVASGFLNFCSEGTGFSERFPGIKPSLLMFKFLFRLPLIRDFYMALGMCEMSKDTIKYVCSKENNGNSAVIMVGGATCSLKSPPGSCTIDLRDRKGFIRMALITGAHVVPVFSFGEDIKPSLSSNASFFALLQHRVYQWLSRFVPLCSFFRYCFFFLPLRKRIYTVVGAPIPVVKQPRPTSVDVNRLYGLYVKRLKELFDANKRRYAESPRATLEIVC